MTSPALHPSPTCPADGPGTPPHQPQPLSIIDVNECFDSLIKGYTRLEQSALRLTADLPRLSPENIQQRCRLLYNDQQRLALQDRQVIDILNLVWEDPATGRFITQYRSAFSATMQAIESVQQQLLVIRHSLSLGGAAPIPEDRESARPA